MSAAENEKLGQVREISPNLSVGASVHKKRLTALRKAVATTAHTSNNGSSLRDKRNLL